MVEYYGHNDWRDYHLSHHGVLGMRWGIRRYQPYGVGYQRIGNEGGKITGNARKYGSVEGTTKKTFGQKIKEIPKNIKKAYRRHENKKNLAKARQIRKEKAVKEQKEAAERERILKTGSASELYKNRDKFSSKEINDAISRINTESRLRDLKTEEMIKKADDINKIVNRVITYGQTAKNLLDTGENLMKTVNRVRGAKTKEQIEKEKRAKLLQSEDPQVILDNISDLSNKEIQDISQRQQNIQKIRDAAKRYAKDHDKPDNSQTDTAEPASNGKKNKKNKNNNEAAANNVPKEVKNNESTAEKPKSAIEKAQEEKAKKELEKLGIRTSYGTSAGSGEKDSTGKVITPERIKAAEENAKTILEIYQKKRTKELARVERGHKRLFLSSRRRQSPTERAKHEDYMSDMVRRNKEETEHAYEVISDIAKRLSEK